MYKHLTYTDRLRIEQALKEGLCPYQISKRLRVSPPTIYRELKNGAYTHLNSDLTTRTGYSADIGQQHCREVLSAKGAGLKIGRDHALASRIEHLILRHHYSPEAAAIIIKRERWATTLCKGTIYSYIDKGVFLNVTRQDLLRGVRTHRAYRKIAARPPRGESIEHRPAVINTRSTFGHWEMDTVAGRRRSSEALLVLTERLSRAELILKLPDTSAHSVVKRLDALESQCGPVFRRAFQSITCDNGHEFADVVGMETSPDGHRRTRLYYCHPYCACERGSNENANGILRRFLPKGTDLREITDEYIRRVQSWINNYPRPVLGGRTAREVFRRYCPDLENIL